VHDAHVGADGDGHLRRFVAAPGNGTPGNIDFAAIFSPRDGLLGAETPRFPMLNLTPGFAQNRSQMTTLVAVWLHCQLIDLITAFLEAAVLNIDSR
jgi:hypothetical protein